MKQETVSNTTSNRKLDATEAPGFTVITFIMQYCLLKFPFVAAFCGYTNPRPFFFHLCTSKCHKFHAVKNKLLCLGCLASTRKEL